jgi:hypothetical protein
MRKPVIARTRWHRPKGKFTNEAPNTKCLDTPFDITGHTLKNGQIFFGVTFGPCNTITSWHGSVSGTTYSTTWALSVGVLFIKAQTSASDVNRSEHYRS